MVRQKLFIISTQVMNLGSMRVTPKLNDSQGVWVFQDERKSIKVIRVKKNRTTVNSEWYTTICLPEVFEEIGKNNRQRRTLLHHDNASCHTSAKTTRFLEGQQIKSTGHPPYSPDLAPDDFYLFPSASGGARRRRRRRPPTASRLKGPRKQKVLPTSY
ncbi:Mariner Mos1 transposase [Eumeta japonica]|uniref:Mariner Mos1 transposase n=1 Tax=Eumeta variegata TaxID=151549 RepID=A0A4C1U9V9_EUMVA|nr:Mariner Mos1 transposase [Eumeta japonica]